MISEIESKGGVFEKHLADQQGASCMQRSRPWQGFIMRLLTGSESAPLMSTLTASSRTKRLRKLDNCQNETLYYKYIFFLCHSFWDVQWCHRTVKSCDPFERSRGHRQWCVSGPKGSVCIGCDMKYSLRLMRQMSLTIYCRNCSLMTHILHKKGHTVCTTGWEVFMLVHLLIKWTHVTEYWCFVDLINQLLFWQSS